MALPENPSFDILCFYPIHSSSLWRYITRLNDVQWILKFILPCLFLVFLRYWCQYLLLPKRCEQSDPFFPHYLTLNLTTLLPWQPRLSTFGRSHGRKTKPSPEHWCMLHTRRQSRPTWTLPGSWFGGTNHSNRAQDNLYMCLLSGFCRSYIHPSTRTNGAWVKDKPHITVSVKNPQTSQAGQHQTSHGYTPHITSFDVIKVSPNLYIADDSSSLAWPASMETNDKDTFTGPPLLLGPKGQFFTWPSEETGEWCMCFACPCERANGCIGLLKASEGHRNLGIFCSSMYLVSMYGAECRC